LFDREQGIMKVIFFDAVGTLFYLTKSVGYHYALVGREIGLNLNEEHLDLAFISAWKEMPARPVVDGPREDDDKGWWREIVDRVLKEVKPSLHELDRDNFFEIAYEHFTEAGVWEVYPEVIQLLAELHPRYTLAVISSFDGRLRVILEQLGISKYFSTVFVSSELGVDKPNPEIFRRALKFMGCHPGDALHAGDDPERDWRPARIAGMHAFELQRPHNSLRDLVDHL
jgi:putative hydrolase of the HAD superfamily